MAAATDYDKTPIIARGVCFVDNIETATNSLNNQFNDVEGFDTTDKLLLYGLEDWNSGLSNFSSSFSKNRFSEIEIFGCSLSEKGAKAVGNGLKNAAGRISKLHLDNTLLTAEGAKYIIESIRDDEGLQDLNLQGSVRNVDSLKAVAKALTGNTSIKLLDLKINEIKPEGAEQIAKMFWNNPVLQHLDLFYNNIGVQGAQFIANALRDDQCGLKILNLCCNNIEDAGAIALGEALETNHTLEELHIVLNDIKDDGCSRICDALNPNIRTTPLVNQTFKKLDISANLFKDQAARQIAALIVHNPWMDEINFTGIECTEKGWEYFTSAFMTLNYRDDVNQQHMKVIFSIVDVEEDSLHSLEEAIAGNPNIDYKRRD